MADQALIPGTDDPRFDAERLRERECDMTPRPVVEQLFEYLRVWGRFDANPPRKILDPAAGAGIFASVAREAWPDAEVFTVEPAIEEAEGLRRIVGDVNHTPQRFEDFVPEVGARFDLVSTNPPFSLAQTFVELGRSMLKLNGFLVLLLRASWRQRGRDAVSWLLDSHDFGRETIWPNLPIEVWHVSGPISFRGRERGGGAASIDAYSWWIWGREPRRLPRGEMPTWTQSQLPMLPGSARRWTLRPGSETHDGT